MPRRSAASIAATAEQSATSAANQASNNDGDNSILSVTTEASTAAKVSRGKADKGDPESIGIDVSTPFHAMMQSAQSIKSLRKTTCFTLSGRRVVVLNR